MYQEEYKRWMAADLEDADLMPELTKIERAVKAVSQFAEVWNSRTSRCTWSRNKQNEYLCCSSGYTGTR